MCHVLQQGVRQNTRAFEVCCSSLVTCRLSRQGGTGMVVRDCCVIVCTVACESVCFRKRMEAPVQMKADAHTASARASRLRL